jgi:predicted aconitase
MILTDAEQAMYDGAEGPAVAAAMDLLVRYGEALDAERLVETHNVAGTMTQPSPAKTALMREGGWRKAYAVINLDSDEEFELPDVRVPTCQLQHGFGRDALGVVPYDHGLVEIQSDAEAFHARRGVSVLATCTPYQVGNVPARDEHCAWMESSAVLWCNSVLGARTNCEGTASTGAASLTGRIPYWGNHLPSGRLGTHLVEVGVPVADFLEWGMLGYFVGDAVVDARPVVVGTPPVAADADLKHFGAAAASSGGVEL